MKGCYLIQVPIYGTQIYVIPKHLLNEFNKLTGDDDNIDPNSYSGFAQRYIDEGVMYLYVYLGDGELLTIVHESVHLCNMVLDNVGVKLDPHNDEAQAYLTEWIFKKLRKEVKRLKKLAKNK